MLECIQFLSFLVYHPVYCVGICLQCSVCFVSMYICVHVGVTEEKWCAPAPGLFFIRFHAICYLTQVHPSVTPSRVRLSDFSFWARSSSTCFVSPAIALVAMELVYLCCADGMQRVACVHRQDNLVFASPESLRALWLELQFLGGELF